MGAKIGRIQTKLGNVVIRSPNESESPIWMEEIPATRSKANQNRRSSHRGSAKRRNNSFLVGSATKGEVLESNVAFLLTAILLGREYSPSFWSDNINCTLSKASLQLAKGYGN